MFGTDIHIVRELTEVFSSKTRDLAFSEQLDVRSGQGWRRFFAEAGASPGQIKVVLAYACCTFILVSLITKVLIGLFSVLALVLLVFLRFKRVMQRRRAELDRDLPALLTNLASSVRAGLDPLVALSASRDYFSPGSIIYQELEVFHKALQRGEGEDEAIHQLCQSIQHPDLPLLRSCLHLSRRHGSSLADPLHRVARVVRQRQSFRRKTNAALVMHRMSAIGIVVCAVVIGLMQLGVNHKAVMQAVAHPIGLPMLLFGGFLILSGVVWMMSLGRSHGV